jgi:O-antigen/teichoic acid export membrane protein
MLVGSLAGIRAVEVYNVVVMIGNSLNSIRESFDGILLSAFSRSGEGRFTADLRERLNRATWTVGNIVGLALLGTVLWGRPALDLLASQYGEGYPVLVAMALLTWVNVHGDLSGVMLQGLGRSRAWGLAQVTGFCLNVLANFLLIPRFGALGGILALKGSQIAQGLLAQILLRVQGGGRIWIGAYLGSSARFAVGIAGFCALSLLPLPPAARIALTAAAAAAWFGAFHWRSRQFDRRLSAG